MFNYNQTIKINQLVNSESVFDKMYWVTGYINGKTIVNIVVNAVHLDSTVASVQSLLSKEYHTRISQE